MNTKVYSIYSKISNLLSHSIRDQCGWFVVFVYCFCFESKNRQVEVVFFDENTTCVTVYNISTIFVHDMCCKKCTSIFIYFFRFNHMRKFTNHCNCSVRRKVITLTYVVMIIFFIHLFVGSRYN